MELTLFTKNQPEQVLKGKKAKEILAKIDATIKERLAIGELQNYQPSSSVITNVYFKEGKEIDGVLYTGISMKSSKSEPNEINEEKE